MTISNIVSFISVSTNGRDGGGSISVPGLKQGDVVINAYCTNDNSNAADSFQPVVSTDDEIEQVVGFNLTSQTYSFVFLRR